ncbi:MAG: indole-3-glycerol phosphate synthase TrpC [Desulfatitalea sp.]|nr:indole-3-glycerol phosphate synthase TrpC [Desulfatitalea sp.]NNJ99181.1 indole-3-glycerol phosphate synthase TrpC [Desulfatitalea sp.]
MMTILERIVADKKQEIAAAKAKISASDLRTRIGDMARDLRGFQQRLAAPGPGGVNIIAEVKRASPSKGDICKDLDAVQCARQYAAGGAAAVSVLTDTPYFKGSLNDLRKVRAAVTLPVLRKEFIIDPYQVYETFIAGADALLLIVRILSASQLNELASLTAELGMDALVEIHTPAEYEIAHAAGAGLIGINNRNLATFDTDLDTAVGMAALFQPDEIPVTASGIHSRADIEQNLASGIFNFLVGESLVRAKDRKAFLRTLIGSQVKQ